MSTPADRSAPGPRAARSRRRSGRAVTMVEFAMTAPVALVLLVGLVVLGIVITHQMQLNQAAKNSARAVAICGDAAEQDVNHSTTWTLPNGQPCATAGNIQAYVAGQFAGVTSSPGYTVTVSGGAYSWGQSCLPDQVVEVKISYSQPLYLPLVGYVLGDGGSNSITLSADGESTC